MKKRQQSRSRAPAADRALRPRLRPSRRSTDAELAADEARFRALTALSSDWYWEQDAEYRFTRFSSDHPGKSVIGEEGLLGRRRWELAAVRLSPEAWAAHRADLDARRVFRNFEYPVVDESGEEHWFSVSGQPVFDASGTFTGYRGVVRRITERKRAEAAAAQSEARFRSFAETGSDWFWETDAEDRYTWLEGALERQVGRDPKEYLGRTRIEVAVADGVDITAASWTSHMALIARRESFRDMRQRRVTPKGELWISVSGTPRFDAGGRFLGYRASVTNVTAQMQAEEALRQSEARFRSLAELSSDWYWEQDTELRFVSTSGRESGRGGITAADHTGRRRWELPGTEIVNQTWEEHQTTLAAREPFRDVLLRRTAASGAVHFVSISGEPMFNAQGEFSGYRGIARDVTERIAAERKARAADERLRAALRDTNEELERRVAERTAALETAYRELESFSYSVSHDLRSPLGVIASFAGILAKQEVGRISEDGMRLVSVIDGNAQRMGHLIDALLELMRTSRRALVFRRLDIAGIAGTTCRELQRDYPRARIEIGELPAAQGDEMLIQQVYANLVGNALKFSSKAASQSVQLGAETGDDGPVYFVRDNGAGFDTAHAAKLFKPFERLHSEEEFPGTGIGLALVQLIVQRHGGRIWAESTPGRGSTFRFTLAQEGSGTLAGRGAG